MAGNRKKNRGRASQKALVMETMVIPSWKSPWPESAWQAALNLPPYQGPNADRPIIIGPDSAFPTPDALREYLKIPTLPPVVSTKRTPLGEFEKSPEETLEKGRCVPAEACLVMGDQFWDMTEEWKPGEIVYVWLDEQRRTAWLPLPTSEGTENSKD